MQTPGENDVGGHGGASAPRATGTPVNPCDSARRSSYRVLETCREIERSISRRTRKWKPALPVESQPDHVQILLLACDGLLPSVRANLSSPSVPVTARRVNPTNDLPGHL